MSFVTPKKNTAFRFFLSLTDQSNAKVFKANPTLAAGDVKVSIDGGAEANITTLPVVAPAGSKRVQVDLSAAEMNGDNITLTFSDAAGAEWCDLTANIQTTAQQIDDLATTAKILAMIYEGTDTFQAYLRLSSAVLFRLATGLNTATPIFWAGDGITPRVSDSIVAGVRTPTLNP